MVPEQSLVFADIQRLVPIFLAAIHHLDQKKQYNLLLDLNSVLILKSFSEHRYFYLDSKKSKDIVFDILE